MPKMKSKSRRVKSKRKPISRGPCGLSVAEAGRLIGLGKNAAYAAVKAKQIPSLKIGGRTIVPRAVWLRQLGVDDAA